MENVKIKITKIERAYCPVCAKQLNVAMPLSSQDTYPVPGAIVICVGCAGILILNDDLSLRVATEEEAMGNLDLRDRIRIAVEEMMQRREEVEKFQ